MKRRLFLVMLILLLVWVMPVKSHAAMKSQHSPIIVSPINSFRTNNGNWPRLQWKNGLNTTALYGYRIQVSTTSTFYRLVVDECVLTTSYLPSSREWMRSQTGTYYWRVNYAPRTWSSQSTCKSMSLNGKLWSAVRSFTNVKPQNKVIAVSPNNGYTSTNQLWPRLSWSAGDFMTNYYRYGYRILVWKSTASGWVNIVDECTVSTSYRPNSDTWMRSQTGTLQWRVFYVESAWNGSQSSCKAQGFISSLGSDTRIFYNPIR